MRKIGLKPSVSKKEQGGVDRGADDEFPSFHQENLTRTSEKTSPRQNTKLADTMVSTLQHPNMLIKASE